MTVRGKYRLALIWFGLVALLSAVDFGLATGRPALFLADFPDNVLTTAEFVLHVTVLLSLRNRYSWGWALAVVWVPVWISYNSFDLFRGGEAILTLLWLPFFLGSAVAHRFILADEVREAFGVHRWPWNGLQWLAFYTFGITAFVPLSITVGTQTAAAICFAVMLIVKTAPWVYGDAR
ncbi:MAG: hypothetical protein GF331_03060 [Chitinivibrionales bacterium]|nr:hypothetical protein [Chitinivibrionales bacterium]